jgi:hypothetical protein
MAKKILCTFMMILLLGGIGLSDKAKADLIIPHAAEQAKIMKKNGLTQFDSKRVLYITRYFLKSNPLLSTFEATIMALRRIGLANNDVVSDIASFLPEAEAVFVQVNNRTAQDLPNASKPKMEMKLLAFGDARMKAHVDADNTVHVLSEQKASNISGAVQRPNERANFGDSNGFVSDLGFMLGVNVPF